MADLGKIAVTPRGEYNASKIYEILDLVTDSGNSYISKLNDNDKPLTDYLAWQLSAKKGDTGTQGSKGDTGFKTIDPIFVKPEDLAPTTNGTFKPIVISEDNINIDPLDYGTLYPNHGNLRAKEGYDTLFNFEDGVWKKSETKLAEAKTYIMPFANSTFPLVGSDSNPIQRTYDNRIWQLINGKTALATDTPSDDSLVWKSMGGGASFNEEAFNLEAQKYKSSGNPLLISADLSSVTFNGAATNGGIFYVTLISTTARLIKLRVKANTNGSCNFVCHRNGVNIPIITSNLSVGWNEIVLSFSMLEGDYIGYNAGTSTSWIEFASLPLPDGFYYSLHEGTILYHTGAYLGIEVYNDKGPGDEYVRTFEQIVTERPPSDEEINVITVDKLGSISTIGEAITLAKAKTGKVIININPGIYNESVDLYGTGFDISLIGKDRRSTIILQEVGDYYSPPLQTNCNTSFQNLTFRNTQEQGLSNPSSYAAHSDYGTAPAFIEFINCEFIQDETAQHAYGAGSWQGHTLRFHSCIFRKNNTKTSAASLYWHNAVAQGVTAQKLEVLFCEIYANGGLAVRIHDANQTYGGNNSQAKVLFIGNTIFSDNTSDVFAVDETIRAPGALAGNIFLDKKSHGNNIAILNAV